MKKNLLLCAAAMLFSSVAMAQTFTDQLGVTYEVIGTPTIASSSTVNNHTLNAQDLVLSVKSTTTNVYNNVNVKAKNTTDEQTVQFKSGVWTNTNNSLTSYNFATEGYVEIMQSIDGNDDDIYDLSSIPSGSSISPQSIPGVYYIKSESLFGTVYTAIATVSYENIVVDKYNYTPTAIASGFVNGKTTVSTISLANTITTIEAGAFLGCSSLTAISVNKAPFVVENGILYNSNKTRVITAYSSVTGTINLPSTVTSIDAYAFSNCKNLTVITNATTIGREQGSTTIKSLANAYSMQNIVLANGGKGIKVTGYLSNSAIQTICDNLSSDVCYVDFTGVTGYYETITKNPSNSHNPNCLFYFNQSDNEVKSLIGANILHNGYCSELKFNEGYKFWAPKAFSVSGTTTYTRAQNLTKESWSNVCLPFSGKASGLTFGTLQSFVDNTFNFTASVYVEANIGVIVKSATTGATFTFTGVQVPASSATSFQNTVSDGAAYAVGTLVETTYDNVQGGYKGYNIYTTQGGKFVNCASGLKWRAYRAFFPAKLSSAQQAPALRVQYEDGNIIEMGTAIDFIQVPTNTVEFIAIQGGLKLQTQEAETVQVVALDGKVVFNEVVDGTKFVYLSKGIYLVGDKKVVVR